MTDADLVGHIARLPHRRGNFKQLIRELGAKGAQRGEVETALARLAARGDLIELRSGHYAVTAGSREFAVGRLNMHRDGYGFLISDRPMRRHCGRHFHPARIGESGHARRPGGGAHRAHRSGRARGWRDCEGAQARLCHGGGRIPDRAPRAVRGAARRPHPAVDRDSRGHGVPARRPGDRPHRRRGAAGFFHRRAERHDRERGAAGLRKPDGPRDRDPRPARRFRRGCGDRHPQAPASASLSAGGDRAGASESRTRLPRRRWKAAAIFATWTWLPSMAKRRAISTTRCGWTGWPTAITRCTCTSPTSATTCSPERPSTRRPACAEPASTSPTARCPCCRSSFRPTSARWCRTRTGWCSRRCWRSTTRAKLWPRSLPPA